MFLRTLTLSIILTALTTSVGCARNLRFQPIDAFSGSPLTDVKAERHSEVRGYFIIPVTQDVEVPMDRHGTMFAMSVDPGISHMFRFFKPGFEDTYVAYPYRNSHQVSVVSRHVEVGTAEQNIQNASDIIVVKMYRIDTSGGDGR